ncbi:unnamed protein product [Lampetra planeri]
MRWLGLPGYMPQPKASSPVGEAHYPVARPPSRRGTPASPATAESSARNERERERSEAERVYPKLRTPSLPLLPGSVREQEGPFLQRPGRCEGADPGPLVSSPRRELSKERTPPPPPPPPDISLPKSHRTARRPYHGHGSLLPFPQAVARKEPRL